MKSGQILILVLLVVVVALAVGLSVASRNITNLRTSTQTEQSQRAFSAAEGGVEDVLSRLNQVGDYIKTGTSNPGSSGCQKTGDNANCQVDVGNLQQGGIQANVNVKANSTYKFTLKPGEVGQVNLSGYNGNVSIKWTEVNNQIEDPVVNTSVNGASVELTFVCGPLVTPATCLGDTLAPSGYGQHREAYFGSTIGSQTGFSAPSPGDASYRYKVEKNVSDAQMLRIKPFWNQTTVEVTGGVNFPVQTYEVESVATTDIGVTRRVRVTRTALEQLPAAFDYVLFSEGDIAK